MARHTTPPAEPESLAGPFADFSVAALITARLWMPTEGTFEGETLHIAVLTFAAGIIWCWLAWRDRRLNLRGSWIDVGVGLLVLGHFISTAGVFTSGGQLRSALNGAIEWGSLGVLWMLLRQRFTDRRRQQSLLRMLIASGVALAFIGMWQHFIWYEATSNEYLTRRAELERLTIESAAPMQLEEARQWFVANGVPLEGTARTLWEQRLLHSREPFGQFALANTFGGLLGSLFCLAIGWSVANIFASKEESNAEQQTPLRFLPLLMAIPILITLLLTKSRTAWVGTLCGVTIGVVLMYRERFRMLLNRWTVAAAALAGTLVLAAIITGGLDAEVVSEAPKSIRFRMQYWDATAAVIRDQPLLGTGSGNFRSAYLQHKLPQASEEISDPHNWILDLWVNGGILALIGVGMIVWSMMTSPSEGTAEQSAGQTAKPGINAVVKGSLVGLFLPLLIEGFILGEVNESLWISACVIPPLVWIGTRMRSGIPLPFAVGGMIALLVHMLGAGGIEMPAIVGIVFFLLTMIAPPPKAFSDRVGSTIGYGFAIVAATGLLVGAQFGVRPVWTAESLVTAAEADLVSGNRRRAVSTLEDAIDADHLSPAAAETLASVLSSDESSSIEELNAAWQTAIDRHPQSPHLLHNRGMALVMREAQPEKARSLLERAVDRYPTSSRFLADLAIAFPDGNGEAAKRAIELDDINRAEGHLERYLPDETRSELERILEAD